MKNVEMMNEFQRLKGKYMAREAGPRRLPLPMPQKMPTIQEEDGSMEQITKNTLQKIKDIMNGDRDADSLNENLVREYHPSKDKTSTRSLDEPPGIRADPKAPWEVPLPESDDEKFDDDDEDGDKNLHPAAKAIKDHWKLFPGPLGYDDTEDEREYKLAWSNHLKNNLPEPPIDEKDTMPGMLSFDDTEEERRKKFNYRKKYPKDSR